VLIEGQADEPTVMDHLGVEVESSAEVEAATSRLSELGLFIQVENDTSCCYAVQDKVWVHGPGAMTVASPAQGSYNLVRAHRNAPGPSASWRAWSGGSVVGAVMGVSSFAWNVITDLRRSGGRVSVLLAVGGVDPEGM
jgi:hypothetical protein